MDDIESGAHFEGKPVPHLSHDNEESFMDLPIEETKANVKNQGDVLGTGDERIAKSKPMFGIKRKFDEHSVIKKETFAENEHCMQFDNIQRNPKSEIDSPEDNSTETSDHTKFETDGEDDHIAPKPGTVFENKFIGDHTTKPEALFEADGSGDQSTKPEAEYMDSIQDHRISMSEDFASSDNSASSAMPKPEVGVITFNFSDIIHRKKRQPRKLVNRSLEDKYRAIHAVEGGTMKSEVARVFGVPANTLSTWLKHRDKIKYAVETNGFSEHRRKMRTGKHENVNSVLYAWYTEACKLGIAVNGPILQQKAREFAQALGEDDFTGSTGWLCRFKDRHNIAFRAPPTDKLEKVDWFNTSDNVKEENEKPGEESPLPGLPNYEDMSPHGADFLNMQQNFVQESPAYQPKGNSPNSATPTTDSSVPTAPSFQLPVPEKKRARYSDQKSVAENKKINDIVKSGVKKEKKSSLDVKEEKPEVESKLNTAVEAPGSAVDAGLVPSASEFLELCGRMRMFMYCHREMSAGLSHLCNIEQMFARVCTKK